MTAVASDHIGGVMQENESHQKSSEEALTHLEEVIAQVISEAVDYADKPPEERTLPALVRKSVTQARSRQAAAMNNFGRMNPSVHSNGSHVLGLGHVGGNFSQGFNQGAGTIQNDPRFVNKISSNQTANMLSFGSVQNAAALQQSQQQLMAQYNGLQPNQYHVHQQYAQAAQQFQLQQQAQSQYQGNATAAFTHMQLQQQQNAAATAAVVSDHLARYAAYQQQYVKKMQE
ncbi:hypothetical protein AAHC03_01729 [Spirometra sp. Aus1]